MSSTYFEGVVVVYGWCLAWCFWLVSVTSVFVCISMAVADGACLGSGT